jgi:hypothetical protein
MKGCLRWRLHTAPHAYAGRLQTTRKNMQFNNIFAFRETLATFFFVDGFLAKTDLPMLPTSRIFAMTAVSCRYGRRGGIRPEKPRRRR